MTYLEHEGTMLTVVRRFQIVSLSLYHMYVGGRLIGPLAQRYYMWPAISYVLVSINKLES
jgi:hypothetical protein